MTVIEESFEHAERMNRMYRLQRHIYDLTRKYYLLGRDRVIAEMQPKPGARILELGCGTGRNLKRIGETFSGIALCGLDISDEMLISARQNLGRAGIETTLVSGDATRFQPSDFLHSGFDHILLSYALSMIPQWEETIENAVKALAPGGRLHIVDFGRQERLPRWFSLPLMGWLKAFHVTPRTAMKDVAENVARKQGASCRFASLYRGYACMAEITRSA